MVAGALPLGASRRHRPVLCPPWCRDRMLPPLWCPLSHASPSRTRVKTSSACTGFSDRLFGFANEVEPFCACPLPVFAFAGSWLTPNAGWFSVWFMEGLGYGRVLLMAEVPPPGCL